MLEKHFTKLLIALVATASLSANATTFTYSGVVTDSTLLINFSAPVGSLIGGDIEIDAGAVAAGIAAVGDILDIGVAMGDLCFTYGAGACTGMDAPITSIDASTLTFNAAGEYSGGDLSLTARWPNFGLDISIVFSGDGTFAASSPGGGTADGTGQLLGPIVVVPVPAAIWLLGSALVGMIGFRRRT